MSKTVLLKLTSAITIGGEIAKRGDVIEVSEVEAKNLLSRGKAELNEEQQLDDESLDITKMNKDQLVSLADQMEIEGADKMTKAQLIEAIEAHEGKPEGEE